MKYTNFCKSLLFTCTVGLAACDAVDDQSSRSYRGDIDESDDRTPESRLKVEDVPEEVDGIEADWSEFDITDHEDGVAGPPGKTCCVDCGDGWSGWYNLGTADNCNGRGANFCHQNWWYFINAEWRSYC